MDTLSRKDYTLTYADATPSELIHNSNNDYIVIGLINYFNVERNLLKPITQYKNTRGLSRKLKSLEYIIDCFEKKLIIAAGVASWNERQIALDNGALLLKDEKLIDEEHSFEELISINGQQVKYGRLLSLAWYSIAIVLLSKNVALITKVEGKTASAILIDLLPGDDKESSSNLSLVRYIVRQTQLDKILEDAMIANGVKKFGFGYGIKNDSTKEIKNDFEYTIMDWIVQSFHSLLLYEKVFKDKNHQTNQLANLARYLLHKNIFKFGSGIRLTV